ncbi:MAG: hypothetical protein V4529_16555 [Gemmatimonadota bacterium]
MSKPEIGSKWRCARADMPGSRFGAELTVVSHYVSDGNAMVRCEEGESGVSFFAFRFASGDLEPIDTAPAVPAKAAEWKVGDRVVMAGTVKRVNEGTTWDVTVDFGEPMGAMAIASAALRPEFAPPAAAPAVTMLPKADCTDFDVKKHGVVSRNLIIELGESMAGYNRIGANFDGYLEEAIKRVKAAPQVAASIHGIDTRGVLSQLADARSDRDRCSALADKRGAELDDMQRRCDRLLLQLQAANAKLARRGPL